MPTAVLDQFDAIFGTRRGAHGVREEKDFFPPAGSSSDIHIEPQERSTHRATFHPQAWWVGDNAIEVDPQGATEWDVSPSYLASLVAQHGDEALEDSTYPSDELHHDTAAPEWVRDWSGPFYVSLQELP